MKRCRKCGTTDVEFYAVPKSNGKNLKMCSSCRQLSIPQNVAVDMRLVREARNPESSYTEKIPRKRGEITDDELLKIKRERAAKR